MTDMITIEADVVVCPEDIDDIMVSALEGGINYWCDEARVQENKRVAEWGHEQIARGGSLMMHTIEPFDKDETEWYELTKEKFLQGLKMYLQDPDDRNVLDIDRGKLWIDAGYIDGNAADEIIQYALFGEIVYA